MYAPRKEAEVPKDETMRENENSLRRTTCVKHWHE